MSSLGGTYNKANSEVRKYAASLRKATDDQLRMTQATNMAGKSTNRFGMYAQQVGYQVGDFFVQVQSGTSALVAFGQQGTQLAGLLPGVAGAVVGISLAVGTMLLRSFLEMKKATNDASAGFVDYEASLKSAKEETQSMSEELMVLEGNFRSVAHAALDKALRDAEAALNKAETAEIKTKRLSDEAREQGLQVLRDAVQVAQDNLDKHLELNTTLSKTASLEEARLNSIKLFYEYRQRDADAAKKLAEAVEKIKKEQEAVNRSAREQLRSESQKIELLEAELKFGKESVHYKYLVALIEDANLRRKLKAKNVDKDIIDAIINQLDVQRTLSQEISDSADEAERIAKAFDDAQAAASKIKPNFAGVLDPRGESGSVTEAMRRGYQFPSTTDKPSTKSTKVKESDLEKLRSQLQLERALVYETEARQRVIQALGVEFSKKNPETVARLEKQIQLTKELIQEEQQRKDLIGFVADSMGDSFMAMVDGTKSVKDAFREMASDIVKELYRVLVVQQMVNSAKTFLGGFFADGGAFSGGSQIQAYADGGVVGSPTYFGMSGGKTGLMGEAGPEAIMPLKRGANGKLGVQMEGNGGGVTINQNINISTGVQQTVRSEIKSMMPQIAEQSKAAVLDAKRRGGSYGSKF